MRAGPICSIFSPRVFIFSLKKLAILENQGSGRGRGGQEGVKNGQQLHHKCNPMQHNTTPHTLNTMHSHLCDSVLRVFPACVAMDHDTPPSSHYVHNNLSQSTQNLLLHDIIDWKFITLKEEIGRGSFGRVYAAEYLGFKVCAKEIVHAQIGQTKDDIWLHEVKMLKYGDNVVFVL